jgi:membrane protease YdiL (CAAX protease family)
VGFPAGAEGVALSFLYGLALGVIRLMTGGLWVAVIAHVATNATIAALVIVFLLSE